MTSAGVDDDRGHFDWQCCYVAHDYKDEETLCSTQPGKLKRIINLSKFGLPEGAYRSVC